MLFVIALIDACIIGVSAVALASAYALGDVLSVRCSLHRKPTEAKVIYALYFSLIIVAAGLVLTPGTPLGLLTNLVQTLAGVLLPSATVFLLLLCNDKAVLGPWVNTRLMDIFTAAVIAVLVMLSVVLTAPVLSPSISEWQIIGLLGGGSALSLTIALGVKAYERHVGVPVTDEQPLDPGLLNTWRIPSPN